MTWKTANNRRRSKRPAAKFGSLDWAFDQMERQWGDDPILGMFFGRE